MFYWRTLLGAVLATGTMVGLVLLLVWVNLRPSVIEGERYIFRALFLDKETKAIAERSAALLSVAPGVNAPIGCRLSPLPRRLPWRTLLFARPSGG